MSAALPIAPLIIAIGTVFGYLAIAPAVVNGDGLGYLKASVSGGTYAGHLLYLPLLRWIQALADVGHRPIDGLGSARLVSAIAAGIAVLALAAATRRLVSHRHAPILAAVGLAGSFGFLAAGSDVESYAPALAALCTCLFALALRRTGAGNGSLVGAGALLALAILFHIENVLFALPVLFALGRRDGVLVLAGAAALVLTVFATLSSGDSSVLQASHGFHYPLTWYTPAVALYGACRTLVFAPYPYEASVARVAAHVALGALALAALGWIALVRESERVTRAPLGLPVSWAWVLPYALVGGVFFPSDPERWVFLLPLFWLTVATTQRHQRLALVIAIVLWAVNLGLWLPRARDSAWRKAAATAGRFMTEGDLVISPGHGWDEYVGIYDGPAVEHFPLVFHVAQLGSTTAARDLLQRMVHNTKTRHHRVWLLRLAANDHDPMGWKELVQFGITRENVATLLPPGRRVSVAAGVEGFE